MIQIRPAETSDSKYIVKFQLAMANETEGISLEKDKVTSGVKAIFNDPTKGQYFVAVNEQEIIGCLLITKEWSDWRDAYIWWLQSLYIVPNHRGKGVFTLMFNSLKDLITNSENVCGLRLYVDNTNKKAQMIYSHLGMSDDHYTTFEWMK